MLVFERTLIRLGDFTLAADFTVTAGTPVAVIGPSGAGKSTLLGALAGFVPLAEGRIFWDGTDLASLRPGARPLSMLFQDQNLFPHLSIAQNLGLGLRPDLRLSPEDRQKVAAALARVGLAGMEGRKPAELSGGQQSRAALGRVLLRQKPLLLLDEPFSALGPAMRAEMLDMVAELARDTETTVLMVSHHPQDALRIAPRTILVVDGIAHAPQDTHALLSDPPAALARYLGT